MSFLQYLLALSLKIFYLDISAPLPTAQEIFFAIARRLPTSSLAKLVIKQRVDSRLSASFASGKSWTNAEKWR